MFAVQCVELRCSRRRDVDAIFFFSSSFGVGWGERKKNTHTSELTYPVDIFTFNVTHNIAQLSPRMAPCSVDGAIAMDFRRRKYDWWK